MTSLTAAQQPNPQDFKTQFGLALRSQDDELVVDFFCGGDGAGTGLEMGLGRKIDVAKNHSPAAISMHTANHPAARHFTTDVFEGDPDDECQGRAVGWFHMSPECTHHSQAAGGQPCSLDLPAICAVCGKGRSTRRHTQCSLIQQQREGDKWAAYMANVAAKRALGRRV